MKVLHLSSERTWRGGEQQIAYLIQELNAQGVQNHVACREGSIFQSFAIKNNIPYIALPFKNQFDITTILGISNYCKKYHISLIHMHSGKSHGLAVLSTFFGFKGSLILSRRVDVPPKQSGFSKWKYNYKSIKRIICVSNKIRSLVQGVLKEPSKAKTIYSGINTDRFKENPVRGFLRDKYGLSQDAILVGNTSALADHKDYPTFIQTAKVLIEKYPNIYFFIIGDGEEKENTERLISESNLNERVIMTGFLKEIPKVLRDLDIFFMPSKTEGLGTSILDAFAAKIPVVATRAGGIPESVIHEKTGLLAEVADVESLSCQIERLIQSLTLKEQLIYNAHQHLIKNFTKEKVASETLKVYKEVLFELD